MRHCSLWTNGDGSADAFQQFLKGLAAGGKQDFKGGITDFVLLRFHLSATS
jgi:hypothetical protein